MNEKIKLLAIDDELENLSMISELLHKLIPDSEVITAPSGKQGIQLAKEEHPDVILLDIRMPELDGFETCSILKETPETKQIPIIMLTAIHTDTHSRIKGLQTGADVFLTKPIKKAELIAQVNVMLRIKRAEEKLRKDNQLLEQKVNERTKELNHNNVFLNTIIDTIPSPFYYKDKNGYILGFNKAFATFFATSHQHNKGKVISDFLPERQAEAFIKSDQKILQTQQKHQFYLKISNAENQLKDTIIKQDIFKDSSGEPAGIVGIIIDITERKKTEKKLTRYQAVLKAANEQSPVGVIVMLPDETLFVVNQTAREIIGINKEKTLEGEKYEVLTKYFSLYNPDLKKYAFDEMPIFRALKGEAYSNLEVVIKQKTGKKRWLLLNAAPIKDQKNQVFASIVVFLDITQRKQDAEKLSYERDLLQSLMDNIPDTIYFKDKKSRFLRINRAQAQYFGLNDPDEAIGKSDFDFFSQEFAQITFKDEQRILKTGKPMVNKTEKPIRIGGKERWVSATKMPLRNKDGKIKGLVGISRDITERKLTEQDLKIAKEKAEESDKLKTAFLSNLSHEIRTPMNAIIGFSGLLSGKNITDDKRNEFVNHINHASENLLKLINDIIDISKIEAEQFELNEKDFNINKLLLEVFTLANEDKQKLDKKHIKIEVKIPNDTDDLELNTDQFRLQQILLNLLENALKFTDEGSIEFGYELSTEDNIKFFVKDTGKGIPEAEFKNIFERFRKLEDDKNKLYGGTGLGLSICKHLIDMMGGEIWLASSLGKGSTFYFTLPLKNNTKSSEKESTMVKEEAFNWADKTVLIVEDEEINYIFFEEALIDTGINMLWAKNGKEAVDIFIDQDIDLVLMDIKMPEMNGYDACDQIKEMNPDVPVLAQTAYALAGEKEQILESGFDDYIAKPIKQKALLVFLSKYV